MEYLKSVLEIFKGPKETVETPGYGNIGDPAIIVAELRILNQRISQLETRLETMGSAFIKAEDRPRVGPQKG
jgi:exopolysaccharide biosynthesis predicted pyruvyltransferase EpsI